MSRSFNRSAGYYVKRPSGDQGSWHHASGGGRRSEKSRGNTPLRRHAQRATGAQPEPVHRRGWSVEPWARILPLLMRAKVPPQIAQTLPVVLVVVAMTVPSRSADGPQKVSR